MPSLLLITHSNHPFLKTVLIGFNCSVFIHAYKILGSYSPPHLPVFVLPPPTSSLKQSPFYIQVI
jgi:hypothetical protein